MLMKGSIGLFPPPSKIITFLVGDPNLNLHLPQLLGGQPKGSILSDLMIFRFSRWAVLIMTSSQLLPSIVVQDKGLMCGDRS